jgi:myo-inositol-1-phosphate synthase
MGRIAVAIVGVGNCASSLLQGLARHRARPDATPIGLMHPVLGGYGVADVDVVCAFDVDARKVGRRLHVAALAPPTAVRPLCDALPPSDVVVQMGPVLDGVAAHMAAYPEERAFRVADAPPVDVAAALRRSGAEVLVSYLPVGSQAATEHYARACLDAGVAMVNCIPAFIASEPRWAAEFAERRLPIVGDDVKSQVGATILHRVLAQLFADRGVVLDRTYQLNVGGNTDFLNMLAHDRLDSKRISKTEAVQSVLPSPLPWGQVHIGPSDWVPWLGDNKVCFLRMEGRGFGDAPIEVEVRLSVQDSPNSAGCVIDAIRCCAVARARGVGGPLLSASAYLMKHPPEQRPDDRARDDLERFLRGEIDR